MRRIRGAKDFAEPGPKECWHPYGLQLLQPDQFTSVVNSILKGERRLLPVARTARGHLIVYRPLF